MRADGVTRAAALLTSAYSSYSGCRQYRENLADAVEAVPGAPRIDRLRQYFNAFLRRAGWEVRMLPALQGSYEACPPTLIDVAVRDRRWAQGNLQHMRLVAAKGLRWVSRLHLAMGAYAYLASVLWLMSLAVGVVLSLETAYTLPVYFPDKRTLFPVWPVIDFDKGPLSLRRDHRGAAFAQSSRAHARNAAPASWEAGVRSPAAAGWGLRGDRAVRTDGTRLHAHSDDGRGPDPGRQGLRLGRATPRWQSG